MSMLEIKLEEPDQAAKIIVIGVGGGGNNAVNRMIEDDIQGVDFVAVNTDKQVLQLCKAQQTVQIGEKITGGRGAGAKPEVGEQAANENTEAIEEKIRDADMVIVTCGMGGGTGTGASPVIAKLAHDKGILTVGVVTKPFRFESPKRMKNAEGGIEKLKQNVDSLIVIPNEKLLGLVDRRTTLPDAMKIADEVLEQTIQGITDLINVPALINLDFADVETTMRDKGIAHVGIGKASGDNKAMEAVQSAVSSPLLETTIEGASNCILNITGDISLIEVNEAASYVQQLTGEDTNIIFGARYSDAEPDTISVTVIATGVTGEEAPAPAKAPEKKSTFSETLQQAARDHAVREAAEVDREAVDRSLESSDHSYSRPKQRSINIPDFLSR